MCPWVQAEELSPPSIRMTLLFSQWVPGRASSAMAEATSFGSVSLSYGFFPSALAMSLSDPGILLRAGVFGTPAQMALTVI